MSIQGLMCERVSVPGNRDLLRVTVECEDNDATRIQDAELVAADHGALRRFHALPDGQAARAPRSPFRSLGFAVPAELRDAPLTLRVGEETVALPQPTPRRMFTSSSALLAAESRALELATAVSRAESDRIELESALRWSEIQLHLTRTELDALRNGEQLPPEPFAAPAVPVASRSRRTRALVACLAAVVVVVSGLASWPVSLLSSDEPTSAGTPFASARPAVSSVATRLGQRLGIPAAYVALYRKAGARYGLGWTWLAAVGHVETENGQSLLPGVHSGSNELGATGPAQFLPATWELYGLDGNGDGTRNPHDPADAIPAMASYLRASGAPGDWPGALLTYNHSAAYVQRVQKVAARYRQLLIR